MLAPGERIVLWADDSAEQGELHLPFKLSSEGETLELQHVEQGIVDSVPFPELGENESFARFIDSAGTFSVCRYATPGRSNGAICEPPSRPTPVDTVSYAAYQWPEAWPALRGPLTFSELALNPADFIEVLNISDHAVPLHEYAVRLSTHAPGLPWPDAQTGTALAWGDQDVLLPGERLVLPVSASAVSAIAEGEHFSGVASLFEVVTGNTVERVELEDFPANSALARQNDRGALQFCEISSKGSANTNCDPLASREVGGRLGNLRNEADFNALAEGGTTVGIESVKFIVDLVAGDVVHFLSSRDYALHYTFVREEINHEEHLDRCDPAQAAEFYQGWVEFSQEEYFRTQGRRYLLGTLNHHVGPDLHTVDFTEGDAISAEQMLHAFFTVTAHLYNPKSWVLHPSNDEQLLRLLTVNGRAPIVGENAPYRDITLQPLTTGVAYGQLRFIPSEELQHTALGQDVIVITDDVPNDIPFVGGLITEAFQTPLAHVNVLSRSRNTPNLALHDARHDPRIADHLGDLVRFEVTAGGFTIEPAALPEAQAFWDARRPEGPRLAPRLDLSSGELQSLADHDFDSIPLIGAKAAQLAELQRMFQARQMAGAPLPMPERAFAIPVVRYLEHFENSGAQALYDASASALSDPSRRPQALAAIRSTIEQYPIDSALIQDLEQRLRRDFGNERVRFRSSSNTEDLADFNGAGLYTSISAELDDPDRSIIAAVHTVWASLWNARAYDEREYANIDHSQAAMGVLVHGAYLSEKANGVAISRDI
ncbi:MAG TPA: PEP/pyruvate-binding domain-containing protein, partial [Polyangiaceae bacterium]|nr:PEP/pyruvate-binding domain-containing protein [Polyangiaceae bacterium]